MIRLTTEQAGRLMEGLRYLRQVAPGSLLDAHAQDIMAIAQEQLDHPNHAEDIISTVVRVLTDRNFSRGMGSTLLDSLRKSILSPSELAKFNAQLNKGGSCHGCGVPFADYGCATYSGSNFYCPRCLPPEAVTCPECEGAIDIGSVRVTIKRAIAKHACQGQPRQTLNDPWLDDPSQPSPPPSSARYWTTGPIITTTNRGGITGTAIDDGTT